jgi:uncharacterized protein (TIGR03067 family)
MSHLPNILAFSILLFALAQGPSEVEKDKKLLQGSWEVVSMVQGGKDILGLKKEEKMIFTFEGDKVTVKLTEKSKEGGYKNDGTYKIDPSKTPRTIDVVDDRKEPNLGIYEVKADEIKLCMAGRGVKERPKDFTTPAGTDHSVVILKRVK